MDSIAKCMEEHSSLEKIREAFEKMPEEYREVIVMIHIDGLSYEEAAQTLEIPVGTVMSRLHRGRNFLKKALGKEAEELQIVEKKDRKDA